MKKWVCMEGHEFDEYPGERCPHDGSLIKEIEVEEMIKSEEVKEKDEEEFVEMKVEGDYGLGILVFDMSPSMGEFFAGSNYRKIDVVANAFATTIASLVSGDSPISKPNDYFISMIGFAGKARHLGTFRLAEMKKGDYKDTVKHWEDFILSYPRSSLGGRTNLTDALKIAHEIYSGVLRKEEKILRKYNFPEDFELNTQAVYSLSKEESYYVPNIRVFIYSDGVHNVGSFHNPFAGETPLWPGIRSKESNTPVNGILSIFIRSEDEKENIEGSKNMEEIAGFCPIHETIGFVSIDTINDYNILRGFIHMTSSASGFCLKCLRDLG